MRMNVFAIAAAIAMIVGATSADARPAQDAHDSWNPFVQKSSVTSQSSRASAETPRKRQRYATRTRAERVYASAESAPRSSSIGGRPRAWCGWWMRTQRGGGPEFNLAANWRRYGSPASGPQVGAVVVWPHHVGEIVGRAANGQWLVRSGNDGGAVRTRARSVAGAVFRI